MNFSMRVSKASKANWLVCRMEGSERIQVKMLGALVV